MSSKKDKKQQIEDAFATFQDSDQENPHLHQENNRRFLTDDFEKGEFNPPPPQYQNDNQFDVFRIQSNPGTTNENKVTQKMQEVKKQMSFQQSLLHINQKLSQKTSIQNKISGMKLLCEIININSNDKYSCQFLFTWFQSMKFIETFLHEDAHPQILRNMPTILKFLYEKDQISIEMIKKLISNGLKAHQQFAKTVQSILGFLAIQDLQTVFQLISSETNFQNNNFALFLTSIVSNKHFTEEDLVEKLTVAQEQKNNILSEQFQIQRSEQFLQILDETHSNRNSAKNQQMALKQTQKQKIKALTLNLYKLLIQATESHINSYYPILSKLVSSKQIFLTNELAQTLPQLLKSVKVNAVWILQHCLKLDFGQSSKHKGLKNQARQNFIIKLVNQHLYQYLLIIMAKVRFNKVIVDKILNIIILLSKNYKPLEDIYTQYIWKIIGLNSRQQKQREQFFNFVKDILRNESNFTEQSVYFIFFEVLMNLKAEWFSLKILDCLQMLFMRLNQDLKLISYTDQTYQIQDFDLVGINKFWYIYFHSNDPKVTKKCRDFLWKLTTYNSSSSQIKLQLLHDYIKKIIQYMNSPVEGRKAQFCNKGFDIIDKLMQQVQKKQNISQTLQLTILNQCRDAIAPKSITLKLSQKCRLEHLRQQISLAISPSNSNIKLLLRGQFLKGEKMTLRDLSINNGMTIIVTDDTDEPKNKKNAQQQSQNLKNIIHQLIEIFGSQIDKSLLKYIAEKMDGHQIDKIVQTIMNEQKLATMTSQYQQARISMMDQRKQQWNMDGGQKIVYFDGQEQQQIQEKNRNQDLDKAFIEPMQAQIQQKAQQNQVQQEILASMQPAKFSTILVSNPDNLKQLLACAENSKKRSWETIKNLPNCAQYVQYISQTCKKSNWEGLFPKSEVNQMTCAYYAHLLSHILKKLNKNIKNYMIELGGFGYLVGWILKVGEQVGNVLLEEVTNLLVMVLEDHCKALTIFRKRIKQKQQQNLLQKLIQQNRWIIGFNDAIFSTYCNQQFFSWLIGFFLKQYSPTNCKLPVNIAQILIFYALTNNSHHSRLVQLPLVQISYIINAHGLTGQYIFLSAISKLLIQQNKDMSEEIKQNQLKHNLQRFLDLVEFGLEGMVKYQDKKNVIYIYDLVASVLDTTHNPQKELQISLSTFIIFRSSIDSISAEPLIGMLKLLRLCLKKLMASQSPQSTQIKQRIKQPMSQFSQWLFQQYLFDLQKPGRHIRNKAIRKISYEILQIIFQQIQQLALQLTQKIVQIQVSERNKDEDYIDFRVQEYVGLVNLGATCYFNSLLQQLYHTKFSKLLLNKGDIDSSQSANISELKSIFMQMRYSIKNVVNPSNFITNFRLYGEPINPRHQQDAMELLLCLFDYIQGQGCQKEVYDVFGGYLCNQVIADEGEQFVKNNMEHFNGLSIDILGKKNLQEGLAFFIKPQILDGENKYYCEQLGKKVRASRRCYIQKMPNILILTLKRFEYDYDSHLRNKLNDYFQFPLQLDMHKYSASFLRNKQQTSDSKYKLAGIIVHSGSAQSGHYYSYIKIGEQWFEFNDKNVTEFNVQMNLKSECFGCSEGKKSRNAYMLFYEKAQTNYHGVYLDQIPETNFYKKRINQENAVFLKTRLMYDQNFRHMLTNLLQVTHDSRLQSFIEKIFGTRKKEQKKQTQPEMIHYDADQNQPLINNQDIDEFFN